MNPFCPHCDPWEWLFILEGKNDRTSDLDSQILFGTLPITCGMFFHTPPPFLFGRLVLFSICYGNYARNSHLLSIKLLPGYRSQNLLSHFVK